MKNKTKKTTPQTLKGFRNSLPVKVFKNTKVGIFIDEANIFYIQKELGWKIDWKKFASLFKTNLDLKILRYYLGMPSSGESRLKNLKIKNLLESFGYTVVTKPLKKIYLNNNKNSFKYKCNFDVEIALDIASFLTELDLVIIVSGDSDFVAIKDFVLINKKKLIFVCFEKRVSWEIRKSKYLFLEKFKDLIQLNKNPGKSQGEITK